MKIMLGALGGLSLLAALPATATADVAAGQAKAKPCTACHGANGISVSGDIPNLAGQKVDYLVKQLEAFRAGTRKNAIMNAIASGLSDEDTADLAAFWNSLPGAEGTAVSDMLPEINKTRVAFPADYKERFTHYLTKSFPDRKQVRHYFANEAAVQAARTGRPMPHGAVIFVEAHKAKLDAAGTPVTGADGHFVAENLAFFTAMATGAGWGENIPELYRNGDWNYAVFSAEGKPKPGVNQAKCFACHKPLAEDSHLFTLGALAERVR